MNFHPLNIDKDPLSELKIRLLHLERMVDRRFLKPPLGDDVYVKCVCVFVCVCVCVCVCVFVCV